MTRHVSANGGIARLVRDARREGAAQGDADAERIARDPRNPPTPRALHPAVRATRLPHPVPPSAPVVLTADEEAAALRALDAEERFDRTPEAHLRRVRFLAHALATRITEFKRGDASKADVRADEDELMTAIAERRATNG